jgi:ubiquinone/menaquinone biosynthesis C-methylase UbiE
MLQIAPFEKNAEKYDAWYEQYREVYESELQAVRQQMLSLPENITGIEVGLGTGRFAAPLGVKEGVEPSEEMGKIAVRRGVEVMNARAEKLPYGDLHFDFVLFVTVCHLDDVAKAFKEAWRVLKKGGALIVGFIEKSSPIGREYEEKRDVSEFFRHATFFTADRMVELLKKTGFKDMEFNQTLFGKLDEIEEVQPPRPGYGEGSFVVVKAIKR